MSVGGGSRRRAVGPASIGLASLIGLVACAQLEPRAAGVCGNGVEEPGEDCDFAGGPDAGPGGRTCNHDCRLVCVAPATCPDGWGCGADHVCRHGTGKFHEVGAPIPEAANDLFLADLDGDGRLDLFGYSRARVWAHLALPGGGFGGGFALSASTQLFGAPSFGDLDGDGGVDLAVGGRRSFQVARSRATAGGFAIAPQPALIVEGPLVSLPFRTRAVAPADLLSIAVDADGLVAATIRQAGVAPPSPTRLSASPESFSPNSAFVVDLDGDGVDELAVAFEGRTVVHVFGTVQDGGGHPVLTPRADVELGAPVMHDAFGPVFAADVTGDGVRDLVVRDEFLLAGASVVVAAGDGAGGLGLAVADPTLEAAGGLFALADLDGDGEVDLIGSQGLALRRGGVSTPLFQEDWVGATVADFNRDGLLDVAALRSGADGVELLLATPGPHYTESVRLSGLSTAEALLAGDLDGDRFPDLVVESFGVGDKSLSVLYGGPGGLGTEALALGTARIEAIAVGDLGFAGVPPDAAAELIMQTFASDNVERGVVLFVGNGDRAPLAPYALEADVADVLIGRFAPGVPGPADVLVLHTDGTAELVLGRADATLHPDDRRPVTLAGARLVPWCNPTPGASVGDLDGDGKDEIVGVACDDGTTPSRVQVARFGGTHDAPILTVADVPLPADAAGFVRATRPRLVDLDGDGVLDLVMTCAGDPSIVSVTTSGLIVLWGGGGTVGAASSVIGAFAQETFFDWTPIQLDDSAARELVIDTGVATPLRVNVGPGQTVTRSAPPKVLGPILPIESAMTAGDVDGDGVEDLVFDSLDEIHVLLGCGQDDTTTPGCQ